MPDSVDDPNTSDEEIIVEQKNSAEILQKYTDGNMSTKMIYFHHEPQKITRNIAISPCSQSKVTVISTNPKDGKRCFASRRNLMPRIHRAAMADLKKQEEEKLAKWNLMHGRPATDREPLCNFRSGKWRKILADKEQQTGELSSFRFKSRTKFHEVMLDHEKRNRVTQSKVRRMVDLVNKYEAAPDPEESVSSGAAVQEDDFGIRAIQVEEAPAVRFHGPALGGTQVISPAQIVSPTSTIDPSLLPAHEVQDLKYSTMRIENVQAGQLQAD